MIQIAAPSSLLTGQEAHGTYAVAIDEQQNVLFTGTVDRLNPALATNYTSSNIAPAFISAYVSSHIVHFDDTNVGNPPTNVVGRVTFADPIIALIYMETRLDQSDHLLGNISTTVYPFGVGNRGFQQAYSGLDTVRLLTPNTVEITVGAALDQIRVLTVGVPAPGAFVLAGVAGLAITRRRRW